jgi:hypothetical protein
MHPTNEYMIKLALPYALVAIAVIPAIIMNLGLL